MEVLPVALAEGVAALQRNDLDASVAATRARVDDTADHEPVLTLLALHDGSGGRERHHRVGVHVEDEPSPRAKGKRQGGERRAEISSSEVVEAVEGEDCRVVEAYSITRGNRR